MKNEKLRVPKLRFKEFSGEWEEKELKETSIINPKIKELPNKFIYIDLESVEKGLLVKSNEIIKDEAPSRAQRVLSVNDILFQTVRPYQKNNYFFKLDGDYVASTGYAQIRANESSEFLYQKLHTDNFVNKVLLRCTGTSYPAINSTDLSKIKIYISEKQEQEKIASFLSSIDKKINQLSKKDELLQNYKKAMMQKIFSQKLRFKKDDGSDYPKWKEKKLENFLILTLREVSKPKNNYLAIGVRSHCKGTFQKPNSEPEKIAMDKLYQVKENDLIVSITFAWESAIAIVKKEDENGLVSHRFPTYTFDESIMNVNFFRYVIVQKKFRFMLELISPGGAGRNRVMSKKDFLKLIINLPSLEEQTKIANFLSSLDTKISQNKKALEETQKFKKALLQKMFV